MRIVEMKQEKKNPPSATLSQWKIWRKTKKLKDKDKYKTIKRKFKKEKREKHKISYPWEAKISMNEICLQREIITKQENI